MDDNRFPDDCEPGNLWHDLESRGDDGKVDIYILVDEWEFFKRDKVPKWLK